VLAGRTPTLVIAADSGADVALGLGLDVDLLVGDLDSISPAGRRTVERSGAEVEQHPAAKDHTDLDLALQAAVARGATEVLVLGGAGGRFDHLLGGTLLLAARTWDRLDVTAVLGHAVVTVVHARRPRAVRGTAGDMVSLLAVDGPALGVTTDGLAWPLDGDSLDPGSSRGVSNVLEGRDATVSITGGILLVVQPGPER
jgi:thiamine pyrophosphokinase